jgi:undecaprenyl-phosphate 4-deoxy-4-formamido-L-arabinose transferase
VGTIRMNRKDTFFRRFASSLVNKAIRRATGVMMHDYGCMLRGYHRDIINAMLECREKTTFIPVLANSFARRGTEINVHHAARDQGDSKYSLFKLLTLQFDLLTSMTTFPIRVLAFIGACMSILGVGFGFFLLIARFYLGAEWAADGVFTLFAVLFVFLGAQFFGIGLLGEYIGRIFIQIQGRPSYFIHEVIGHEESKSHFKTSI